MFEVTYEVSETDLEHPFDHVHHAQCLRFLERARLEYLERIGYSFDDFVAQGILLVISRIDIVYKRELMKGGVRIQCVKPRCEGRAIIIDQLVYNHRDKLAVEATVESVGMSIEKRRGVAPPDAFVSAFEGNRSGAISSKL